MIVTYYALCSDRGKKPLTREVFDSRREAEQALAELTQREAEDPADEYWIAELGPEADGWRWLAPGQRTAS